MLNMEGLARGSGEADLGRRGGWVKGGIKHVLRGFDDILSLVQRGRRAWAYQHMTVLGRRGGILVSWTLKR